MPLVYHEATKKNDRDRSFFVEGFFNEDVPRVHVRARLQFRVRRGDARLLEWILMYQLLSYVHTHYVPRVHVHVQKVFQPQTSL